MVLPVGEGGTQQMCMVTRKENNELSVERFEEFSFVPMLTGKES
jgi:protein-L-isoaspartate(D-aspartate) O-methyltransferase